MCVRQYSKAKSLQRHTLQFSASLVDGVVLLDGSIKVSNLTRPLACRSIDPTRSSAVEQLKVKDAISQHF